MRVVRPDPGSSIRTSKLYLRNAQVWQAFKFKADAEETVVEMPVSFIMLAGSEIGVDFSKVTRNTIEWC